MDNKDRITIVGIARLEGIEVIDGGDTLGVRLRGANEREITLLVPQQVAADLQANLNVSLQEAQDRRRAR
ncbi:hypothetical protein [Methylobacterium oxalidis]|uniref:Uncharacterized protein n=1 Tax=Methylobacterium oxalidis TaxID=944322 RepID=A0A512J9I5_9HYPH|nr:hypothetical protein [Methylobacterium oxalidis]GEP06616.1 hypothetical protein MOX02_46540 [Methylobacterium oxalidis]GLS66230.1 hypothetical protein GCM10007888_46120 [Methylobacterium oxalidis]